MRKRANFGGNSLSYLRYGEGYPIVLLHSLQGEAADWTSALTFLGEHLSVYALDLPGRGESFSVEDPDHSTLVARFLDHLGIARAHVVVSPESASIGADIVRRYPRKVGRVMAATPAHTESILNEVGRQQALAFEW